MQTSNTGKSELIDMVFCALLMSAIDREVHTEEWNVIQLFVQQNWKKEYGDFAAVKKQIVLQLKQLIPHEGQLKNKLDQILTDLKTRLNQQQKNQLLKLAADVMNADNIMSPEESDLYALFLSKLGVQSQ